MLARLLRLDEIVAVRVPTVIEEAARDLVRAREDVRGDLMRARHGVSKLLLRHGHVYYGGAASTGQHDAWLRRIRFDQPGTAAAFEADYEQVQLTLARRDRLDAAITAMAADSEFTPVTRRLCCLRGISTLTGFALAVEIGDWRRLSGATIGPTWGWSPPNTPPARSDPRVGSPRPATPTCVGCWSKPPGTTSPPTDAAPPCWRAGPRRPRRSWAR